MNAPQAVKGSVCKSQQPPSLSRRIASISSGFVKLEPTSTATNVTESNLSMTYEHQSYSYLENIERLGLYNVQRPKNFRTPSLSNSQRQKYLNLIGNSKLLKPSSTWRTVKTRRKK